MPSAGCAGQTGWHGTVINATASRLAIPHGWHDKHISEMIMVIVMPAKSMSRIAAVFATVSVRGRPGVPGSGMVTAGKMHRFGLCLAILCWDGPASARVLDVGPGHTYAAPSEAARAAKDGDTVTIEPGTYYDCAAWRASGLIITGTGPDVVISDSTCMGKAGFVVQGDNITIIGLTFARMRVPDGNGAGIRAEGVGLTVKDSRFVNNQVGILASRPSGALRIMDCEFDGNGTVNDGQSMHAVLAGSLDLVRIEGSSFHSARGGGHITSNAGRTELVHNQLTDEADRMSGPIVRITGGTLIFERNTVDLGPGLTVRPGAVLMTGDADSIVVRGNTLLAPDKATPLVRNWTGLTATEDTNTIAGNAAAVSEGGSWYHRMRAHLAAIRDGLHHIAALAFHMVKGIVRT